MVTLALALLGLQVNRSLVPEPKNDEWWTQRHAACVELTQRGPLDVAFLGDSITQGWEGVPDIWAREFGQWKVGNFGFSGDRTEHALWRLQNGELIGAKPKLVVMMLGTNNIGHLTATPPEAAAGVTAVVRLLRKELPTCKVLVLGVFPRAEDPKDPMRLGVDETTRLFKPVGDGRNVRFLDIGQVFLKPDGKLRTDLMPDQLHLNELGYDLWARSIRSTVREMLGEKPERLKVGPWIKPFDGKTLKGFTVRGGTATYRVQDGTIVGTTADGSPNTFLCTDQLFGDFELEFETKVHPSLNSGLQVRSKFHPSGYVSGPQVEIEASPGQAGYLYAEGTELGWMSSEPNLASSALNSHAAFHNEEWNHYRVVAQGARLRTWINGLPVGDVTHEEMFRRYPRGFLGLQVHSIGRGEGPYEVAWRNLRIRELR